MGSSSTPQQQSDPLLDQEIKDNETSIQAKKDSLTQQRMQIVKSMGAQSWDNVAPAVTTQKQFIAQGTVAAPASNPSLNPHSGGGGGL